MNFINYYLWCIPTPLFKLSLGPFHKICPAPSHSHSPQASAWDHVTILELLTVSTVYQLTASTETVKTVRHLKSSTGPQAEAWGE